MQMARVTINEPNNGCEHLDPTPTIEGSTSRPPKHCSKSLSNGGMVDAISSNGSSVCATPSPPSPLMEHRRIELKVVHATPDTQDRWGQKGGHSRNSLGAVDTALSELLLQDPVTIQFLSDFASRYPNLRRITVRMGRHASEPCSALGPTDPPADGLDGDQRSADLGRTDSADRVRSHL
ncbi:uncharacterized protein EI90DRAFT_3043739 [Cantharellus anzutake]|uniref:uncharacterized protein n=1 Tax=Cantharellus anzutake TaxID=1750568 RepID=UPI00190755AE|nr:uncharacterized protein EI90DRAFT_3043739 [Cantharellus anzutake]KAF8336816.1 hypothetical protein EI90DRAFT_3043739 [Cantharellus anzutake]